MQVSPHHTVIDWIPAIGPIALNIHLPQAPRDVRLVPSNTPLETLWAKGVLHVTVPAVAVHDVLVIA